MQQKRSSTPTSYPHILPLRQRGSEVFLSKGGPISTLLDFWSWAYSDLIGNTERGRLAEYIVALALNCADSISPSFGSYDLWTPFGVSVEVKTSAYLQTWAQTAPSKLSFGIAPTLRWDSTTNQYDPEPKRQAQIYVFCILAHLDQATLNPLDLSQWEFWVLPTSSLDQFCPGQKTISLQRLKLLGAAPCHYEGLQHAVRLAAHALE